MGDRTQEGAWGVGASTHCSYELEGFGRVGAGERQFQDEDTAASAGGFEVEFGAQVGRELLGYGQTDAASAGTGGSAGEKEAGAELGREPRAPVADAE